eukprot:1155927-Alexandrium_andersonii.AAC.1
MWPGLVYSHSPPKWAHVKGPISALVATLHNCRWRPISYDYWLGPDGSEWAFAAGSPPDAFLRQFAGLRARQ